MGVSIFTHTGAARRTLVANNHNVTGVDLAAEDGLAGLFLRLEDPCRAAMLAHIVGNSGLLHYAAVGGKVTVHNAQTAVRAVGIFNGTNNFTINLRAFLDPFSHGTVARSGLAIEQAVTTKFADDGRDTADRIQVFDVKRTGRSDASDIRDLLANLLPVVHGNGATRPHG